VIRFFGDNDIDVLYGEDGLGSLQSGVDNDVLNGGDGQGDSCYEGETKINCELPA
jgi:hypothetical protein